jgi:hypothetical protein
MRLVLRVGCAVALVACADSRNPTAPASSRPRPTDHSPQPSAATDRVDPRSLPDRVEALIGQQLARVRIPPDSFSLSPDAVHPDIACAPNPWNTARCWLMYTPYKNSDPSYENPAVLAASSDTTWDTPTQIRNPIIAYPGYGKYNSDPDHALDPVTGRLVQVYRVVGDSVNKIMIMSTADARRWTAAAVAFKERYHDAVSPSLLIEPDRQAKIWYVRSGVNGCAATVGAVELRVAKPDSDSRYEQSEWSAPRAVSLTVPGYVIWHLDVASLARGRGYVALVVAHAKGASCAYSELWLATSNDGLSWRTLPMPVLWRTMKLAKRRSIDTWYRGTLRYDPATDSLHLWPSALSNRTWTVYHTAAKLSDLLGLLEAPDAIDLRATLSAFRPRRSSMPMP